MLNGITIKFKHVIWDFMSTMYMRSDMEMSMMEYSIRIVHNSNEFIYTRIS
ncbi:hypothetical protein Desmer_3020 [Desulfosporosinus meridiei DSM 13257]|uniref:Uncharacterized protein n=1 Tax=Desulfosporosinus meridiei (strain ATCC BAA-275 / DSM 13257 / KCTC 12902 / NCIMB 13706 / S10) TaxID=768704 RepID=J7IXN6_DESMD|nr:hypothetical protein Desmer_3020 [Desulfosporosinus meridiei DSM 13257]